MHDFVLEVCVDTLASARNAIRGGANRLELCGNLVIGGTGPSPTLYRQIREEADIRIHAMVRPRFGDFLYTDSEMEIMLDEVRMWRQLGADGVVYGILRPDGTLDMERMKRLRDAAGDLNVTLHRAFDVALDPMQALEDAREAGVTAILSSGQRPEVPEGAPLLRTLVERSGGIQIMPGNGITRDNAAALHRQIGARAYHLSGNVVLPSGMTFRREDIYMGIPGMSEFERWACDAEEIAAVRQGLESVM